LPAPLMIWSNDIRPKKMKYILLLFFVASSCLAQEIKSEQIPTDEVLAYLRIDPHSVDSRKFHITYAAPKYGALCVRQIVSGKEARRNQIPLGPSTSFGVEFLIGPPEGQSKARQLFYKLSTPAQSIGSSGVIALPRETSTKDYYFGPTLPLCFRCTDGSVTYEMTFVTSDTPFKD
jgi:hypothetical protein